MQHWSTRQLERQISVFYYERLLASRRKTPVRKEAADRLDALEPEQFIRDPYVLEFLDLKDYPALRESSVEQAIIENLQAFLLELGKGFSFVARQKRLRFEEEDFYVDDGLCRRGHSGRHSGGVHPHPPQTVRFREPARSVREMILSR
jgi:predicted nuclease of restriction endonuclease-like (RecB) superfamily